MNDLEELQNLAVTDQLNTTREANEEWLRQFLADFKDPSCPNCKHKYSEHILTISTRCCNHEVNDVSNSSGHWRYVSNSCVCQLTKDEIKLNLMKSAQERYMFEEREKEKQRELDELNKNIQFHIGPPPDPMFGDVIRHLPYYNCCGPHNTQYGGPSRVGTTYDDGGYAEGI